MKKWHLYQKKHINTSAFCTTKIQICPQKFWNPATLSCFSLKSHFSKIKFLSLSSFFSLEFETHLSKFSIQTFAMLSHTLFLFIPNWLHPTMPSCRLSSLSFFHPPLHCTAAIPKYPWSNNHKERPPSHISHYFFFFSFLFAT